MSSQELYDKYIAYYNFYCKIWDLAGNYLSPCIDSSSGVEKMGKYYSIDDISADNNKLLNDRNILISYSNQIWDSIIPGMEDELGRIFDEYLRQQEKEYEQAA